MAVKHLSTLLRLDGVPPPLRLKVHLHQHRSFLIVGASEHEKLSHGGGVLRDGALNDDFMPPSPGRW
jgi:hypothetical protein